MDGSAVTAPASPPLSTHTHDEGATGLTELQQHVSFWDHDNDGIIHPSDVWRGFRDLGFSIPYALLSLLIPLLFSYATQPRRKHPGCAKRDPRFGICVRNIHQAMHTSDSGVFDHAGHFHRDRFDAMFSRFDASGRGYLTTAEFFSLWDGNRSPGDPGGWLYGFFEMLTTWLLIQRRGRVYKDQLLGCYDGSLFFKIRESRKRGGT
ncbi:hypothetical protein CLAIMM_09671 [Cladophialophora immunda]|nr:hypothetical protein CLAIMM_09671 [Cladophialophora immunda]